MVDTEISKNPTKYYRDDLKHLSLIKYELDLFFQKHNINAYTCNPYLCLYLYLYLYLYLGIYISISISISISIYIL